MSPTAPFFCSASSSSWEKVFPLLATNAEGSRAPMPTSAKVTFSKSATVSLTKGSCARTLAALAEPTTPGAGRNRVSPCTNPHLYPHLFKCLKERKLQVRVHLNIDRTSDCDRATCENELRDVGKDEVSHTLTINQGTVTASLILRKLGSYPRQNSSALALRELGHIERTLFT